MGMDECGNTEEKVKPHSNPADMSKSSVSLEESMSQDFQVTDTEWDNASDDACLVEATEDAELAEAANDSLDYSMEDIPDEVLLETLRTQDICNKDDS